MELCITRFNNRTFHENYMYNKKIAFTEDIQNHKRLFDLWAKFNIPSMYKKIKETQIRMKTTDMSEEKKLYRKSIARMRKDISILETMQKEYFHNELKELEQHEHVDAKSHIESHQWMYNVPITIHPSINKRSIYVLEMNNDENKIMGVTKIQNRCFHRRFRMYDDKNYNRYSYVGKRISFLHPRLEPYKSQLELLLFKGSTHQKRGQGIQKIASNNMTKFDSGNFIKELDDIFSTDDDYEL